MSSQLRHRANLRNNGGSRQFGTALGTNAGSSSSGGSSSGAASSRRFTVPSSARRAGKRPSSQGRGSRNQRARTANDQGNEENEADPIADAVGIVEVCRVDLLPSHAGRYLPRVHESFPDQASQIQTLDFVSRFWRHALARFGASRLR